MENEACVRFLQWSLPKLRYQWKGFRKVQKQVCKRLNRRISELDLPDFSAYRSYVYNNDEEWKILDSLCYISISRFYRDRKIFDTFRSDILPILAKAALALDNRELLCWSTGCCSGEEPYTLQILWNLCMQPGLETDLPLRIIATDRNPHLLERADIGVYPENSLKDLPADLIEQAFDKLNGGYRIKRRFKAGIEFRKQDIREQIPDGEFDLILCRNLVFTYFTEDLQEYILKEIYNRLKPNGFLIIGAHESLPSCMEMFLPYKGNNSIYQTASY